MENKIFIGHTKPRQTSDLTWEMVINYNLYIERLKKIKKILEINN
jgi:hypothetical protein